MSSHVLVVKLHPSTWHLSLSSLSTYPFAGPWNLSAAKASTRLVHRNPSSHASMDPRDPVASVTLNDILCRSESKMTMRFTNSLHFRSLPACCVSILMGQGCQDDDSWIYESNKPFQILEKPSCKAEATNIKWRHGSPQIPWISGRSESPSQWVLQGQMESSGSQQKNSAGPKKMRCSKGWWFFHSKLDQTQRPSAKSETKSPASSCSVVLICQPDICATWLVGYGWYPRIKEYHLECVCQVHLLTAWDPNKNAKRGTKNMHSIAFNHCLDADLNWVGFTWTAAWFSLLLFSRAVSISIKDLNTFTNCVQMSRTMAQNTSSSFGQIPGF